MRAHVDDVVDTLDYACRLIQQGWVQGRALTFVDGSPCYCALGALGVAAPTTRVYDAAKAALEACLPLGYESVAAFNDAATQAGVIGLFVGAKQVVQQAVAA